MNTKIFTNGSGAKDWFKDNMERKQYTHNLDKNSVVFDIGAYTGTYTDNIYKKYKCKIHAFEPVDKFFKILHNKYKNTPSVHTHNFGLGECNKETNFYLDQKATSDNPTAGEKIKCEIIDIQQFINNNNIDNIDLMAINIEGGEYKLFEKMIERKLLDKVKIFQIQFHNFPHIQNYSQKRKHIQNELMKTHKLIYNYDFCWEKWEKL